MTVIRSRSFRLIVNVSMLWPSCYRNPAYGDILIELAWGHSHGVPTQLQRELGNIEADVEDVWIVLTHTCGIRATMICGCRAQATVRVWDNGPRWNGLYDASRDSVCKGSTFSRAPSSSLAVSFKSAKQNN